ncbi:hypothetical protein M0R45_009093 [Rubus argutus]|uniref:Uncharacterized protein n=1 Tax=Rubus argutus TaxID=59490 RepID=A0AAW1Y2K6_RUBAR
MLGFCGGIRAWSLDGDLACGRRQWRRSVVFTMKPGSGRRLGGGGGAVKSTMSSARWIRGFKAAKVQLVIDGVATNWQGQLDVNDDELPHGYPPSTPDVKQPSHLADTTITLSRAP